MKCRSSEVFFSLAYLNCPMVYSLLLAQRPPKAMSRLIVNAILYLLFACGH